MQAADSHVVYIAIALAIVELYCSRRAIELHSVAVIWDDRKWKNEENS